MSSEDILEFVEKLWRRAPQVKSLRLLCMLKCGPGEGEGRSDKQGSRGCWHEESMASLLPHRVVGAKGMGGQRRRSGGGARVWAVCGPEGADRRCMRDGRPGG